MLRKLTLITTLLCACSDRPSDAASTPAAERSPAPTSGSASALEPLGTLADSVLARRGKAISVVQLGSDTEGLIVEWRYPDGTYIMGRREVNGVSAYRVIAIRAAVTPSNGPTPTGHREIEAAAQKGDKTLASLYASSFASRYQLAPDGGWAVQDGEFNNTIKTPTLADAILEIATRGTAIVGAGVTFVGSTNLDASRKAFVDDLVRWLDPGVVTDGTVARAITGNLRQAVAQIRQASVIKTGHLTIYAATVGGDAVVSIRLK